MPLNAEFKARVADLAPVRARLAAMQPRWAGVDAQRDTYFDAPNGRLKLREGTVETALIAYTRADIAGVKRSDVTLAPLTPDAAAAVGAALAASLGVRTVVEKTRESLKRMKDMLLADAKAEEQSPATSKVPHG